MDINKAIATLNELKETGHEIDITQDEQDAISLGIEALKRIKDARKLSMFPADWVLPGETK